MRIVQIPLLKDNYGYLLICEKTNQAGIVDPSEGEPVWRRVQEEGVDFRAILNTHHHRDHTGGNEYLLQKARLEVYGAQVDEDRIPGITRPVKEGDEVKVGEEKGTVLFIPGHTRGHIAFLFGNKLFSGDCLFTAGCGRVFEGTAEQMKASLAKLRDLPGDTLVYCGHEYTEKNLQFALTVEPNNDKVKERLAAVQALRAKKQFTVPAKLEDELATNPFLRWESAELQKNLAVGTDAVAVFARTRELKDSF
jgi:hydroxyacylglutathione hydrolase